MWLKLEFPLAGEAEKQENRGRGETEETKSSQFTQAKHLLAHLHALLISSHCVDPLNYKQTHTHTHTQVGMIGRVQ